MTCLALPLILFLFPVSSFIAIPSFVSIKEVPRAGLTMSASTNTKTGPEIEVTYKPDQDFLERKGVFGWGTWGCGVSKFPWTYSESESCYLLKGQVTVTPSDGRKPATFGAGDFVTFPAGMSCTWDVSEAVQKHYMFF